MNIKNRKGLIGFAILMMSLTMIIMASTILFNFFYVTFRLGDSAETMSTIYENLSSGIYHGIWMANSDETGERVFYINDLSVTVTVSPIGDGSYTITASSNNSIPVIVEYNGFCITSWQ